MVEKTREMIRGYQRLEIGKNIVSCPYYMNVAKRSVVSLLEKAGVFGNGIEKFSLLWKQAAVDFGRFQGKGLPEEDGLDWADTDKRDASRAGVFVFAGKASYVVEASSLRGLDLLLMRGLSGKYTHIALLLATGEDEFEVAQSTLLAVPTGINLSRMKVVGLNPVFEFTPGLGKRWEEIFAEGRIEFRRLV